MGNQEERLLFEKGEKNYLSKKALRKTSLAENAPDDEESNLIHSMWRAQVAYSGESNIIYCISFSGTHNLLCICTDAGSPSEKPSNEISMKDTVIKSAKIMQPEDRNRHNFMIFGGFLLKESFELAFCCVASFAHARPNFISLDPSTFEHPVPVGSVLYLNAVVSYTEPEERAGDGKFTRVQVRVDSSVRDVEHGMRRSTGRFNYTFLVEKDIRVMPESYDEFMAWTDARRRFVRAAAALGKKKPIALRTIRESVTE